MFNEYTQQEIALAQEIAQTLGDLDSLPLHLQYAREFKEERLRSILKHVMSLPQEKIKKSRAALYTFLVTQRQRYGGARH